jgi:putative oxidoreductase
MDRVLGRFVPQTYALLRIVAGFLYACHGAQKLFGVLGGHQTPLMSLLGLAGVIEFVGGVLIAIGFLTSVAAFIASGQMAAAYYMVHFPNGFWPIRNGGELAAVYSFLFLYLASRGSGKWSVDGK